MEHIALLSFRWYLSSISLSTNSLFFMSLQIFFHHRKEIILIFLSSTGLDELGLVKSVADLRLKEEGYKLHGFNALISSRLGYHRSINDTRHPLCRTQTYPSDLPTASIVICFYNEHADTLKRSVHSILERTPERFLHEIILVDDFSDLPGLEEEVNQFVASKGMEKVKLVRAKQREGLIRARVLGAGKTSGQVCNAFFI